GRLPGHSPASTWTHAAAMRMGWTRLCVWLRRSGTGRTPGGYTTSAVWMSWKRTAYLEGNDMDYRGFQIEHDPVPNAGGREDWAGRHPDAEPDERPRRYGRAGSEDECREAIGELIEEMEEK